VPDYNYEWRAVFNYETESVENYENRQVTKTRAVYHYEDQDVFNYEDREVLNFEPVFETRQRQVEKRKPPELVCSDGHIIDRSDKKCKKKVEVVSDPSVPHCNGINEKAVHKLSGIGNTFNFTSAMWELNSNKRRCQRAATSTPLGCLTRYKLIKIKNVSYCRHRDASPFGVSDVGTEATGLPFAANNIHTYRTIESSPIEYNQWQPYFKSGGDSVYSGTDITVREASGITEVSDVIWEVKDINQDDAKILAWFMCEKKSASDTVCDSGVIEIDDEAYAKSAKKEDEADAKLSDLRRTNLVCHELGHSIGFHHGSTKTSCMNSGDNGKLDTWELFAIKWHY